MLLPKNEKITLIGAGPVGSLLAINLAKRGMEVEIYERRPDMRVETISAGRSINLAMSVRGLHALREVGADLEALREAVPMRGRMMHAVSGDLTFQPYGKDDSECIYSISRGGLNQLLMTGAEKTGKVKIRFNERLTRYDSERAVLSFLNEKSGIASEVACGRVIGTDGAASAMRAEVVRRSGASVSEELLSYGYKELRLPPGKGENPRERHQMAPNALHIWPRGSFMLIALPNFDGSFTCTLFLPNRPSKNGPADEPSFETLKSGSQVRAFFERYFPDVLAMLPNFEEEFFGNPTGRMVTVKCSPWNISDQALLVGDAAHAIVPFFGQGMNCGFEDCSLLSSMMDSCADWKDLFERFSDTRKVDSDAIADMAVENFVEMRDKVADPRFLLEKQVERILQREFPDRFVSRYALVTFSRAPYRRALEVGISHQKLLGRLCQGISRAEQVDLALAKSLIDELG